MSSRLTTFFLTSVPVFIVATMMLVKRMVSNSKICKCIRAEGPCTVVLTGATGGIGQELLIELLRNDCKVIIGVRDMKKAKHMAEIIRANMISKCGTIIILYLDLRFFKSVKEFADQIEALEDRVDVLINNAAVFYTSERMKLTIDGFEEHFQVNYLSPMLLCELLLPIMTSQLNLSSKMYPRIINITSSLASKLRNPFEIEDVNFAESKYSSTTAYIRSKYALNLYTYDLNKRMMDKDFGVFSLHPGIIITPMHKRRSPNLIAFYIWKLMGFLLFNSAAQCARSIVNVCLAVNHFEDKHVMLKLDVPEEWPTNLYQPKFSQELSYFSRLVCSLPPL